MAPNGEWDVLGAFWGLGMPIDWFDVDHIIATLDGRQTTASQIDQLVLGWDGAEIDCWAAVKRLLISKGYFFGLSSEGKIRFPRLRMATVADVASPTTVTPIPYTLRMEPSEGEGIDAVTGFVGTLPWDPGSQYTVNVIGDVAYDDAPNSLRSVIFGGKDTITIDLSTWYDDGRPPLELASLAKIRSWGAPMLYIRANDPGTIGHGDILKVATPGLKENWFIDDTGTLIDPSDDGPRWFGQVVGFRRNLGDGSIDLTMIMHQWHRNTYSRLRAPSAQVVSGGATATITISQAAYSLDTNTGDGNEFTVGDKVELWGPDGVRRSGSKASPDVQEITAIAADGTTITLDAAFTTAGQVGDIIRWARVDGATAGNDDNDSALYTGYLPYVCMADSADTISPNNLDAHAYGFGTI